ncbi:MAG: PilZ domain-containing protein [Candidatus Acidiferrales bacterium]
MPQELQQRYVPSRRLGKERRTSSRYPFTAVCDATEPNSGAKVIGRTSDLGRGGCYIDTIGPFPPGTSLIVCVNRENQTLRIAARVVFAQSGMGMGLAFTEAEPDQQAILDQWIAELGGEPVAKPAPASPGSATSSGNREGAKGRVDQPIPAVNELIVLLLQKGVLTETEGKSLLQKLRS